MSNHRQSLFTFIGLAMVIGLIVAVRPAPTQGQISLKPASDVNVVNTPSVNANQSGRWSVNVANSVGINPAENTVKVDSSTPVLVRAVEQPFSVYLLANGYDSFSETCTEIPVPEGKRLSLETVAVGVKHNFNFPEDPPQAYVRMEISMGGIHIFDRLLIPLTPRQNFDYSGHLQTRILSGVTIGDGTVKLSLCASRHTSVQGYVVGSLQPL